MLHTLLVLHRWMCVVCKNSSVQICMVKYNRFVQVPSGRGELCRSYVYSILSGRCLYTFSNWMQCEKCQCSTYVSYENTRPGRPERFVNNICYVNIISNYVVSIHYVCGYVRSRRLFVVESWTVLSQCVLKNYTYVHMSATWKVMHVYVRVFSYTDVRMSQHTQCGLSTHALYYRK